MSWPPANSDEHLYIIAEGIIESGGNYLAVNPGSGALGRWQVMPDNVAPWARECGMPVESDYYFLTHPEYQDRMIQCKMGRYYKQYGPRGAAAMWYSGQPDYRAKYGNPPVYEYVDRVIAKMNKLGAKSTRSLPSVASQIGVPHTSNWKGNVETTRSGILHHNKSIHAYHSAVWHTLYRQRLPL